MKSQEESSSQKDETIEDKAKETGKAFIRIRILRCIVFLLK